MDTLKKEIRTQPFTYRRPRCPVKHLGRLIRRLIRRLGSRRLARIGAQVTISATLIASGITIGLTPVGVCLAIAGFCLAFPMEEEETAEEYRQAVIAHFEERGQTPPRWTEAR